MNSSRFFESKNEISAAHIETLETFLNLFNLARNENSWKIVTHPDTKEVIGIKAIVGVKFVKFNGRYEYDPFFLERVKKAGIKTNNSTTLGPDLFSMQDLFIEKSTLSEVLKQSVAIIIELTSARAYLLYLKKNLEDFGSQFKKLPNHIERILCALQFVCRYQDHEAEKKLQDISKVMQETAASSMTRTFARENKVQRQYDLIREEIATVINNINSLHRPPKKPEMKHL